MSTAGRVRFWHDEDGWGVIDSEQTPGGCWAHYSAVATSGYRALTTDQDVVLEWEPARQDGWSFRATRVWPADREPEADPVVTAVTGPGSGAYRSTLTITVDEDENEDEQG